MVLQCMQLPLPVMCRSLVVDSLAENTTISTTRSSNLSPYRILHHHQTSWSPSLYAGMVQIYKPPLLLVSRSLSVQPCTCLWRSLNKSFTRSSHRSHSSHPVLVPLILILMLIRISISSYHLARRIRLLESEDASATQRLVHVVGQLERSRRHGCDMVDAPRLRFRHRRQSDLEKGPRITPAQRRMVACPELTAHSSRRSAHTSLT